MYRRHAGRIPDHHAQLRADQERLASGTGETALRNCVAEGASGRAVASTPLTSPPTAPLTIQREKFRALISRHGVRFVSFSLVGGFVFLLGLGLQAFLVEVCHLGS